MYVYCCVYHIAFALSLQIARELEEILREQIAQPANSCLSQNGVSFLDQVISPLYEVIAAVSLFPLAMKLIAQLVFFLPLNQTHLT